MSIAGIRSNRGDNYQTLVAFDWALTVLTDPDFEWIEVDSVSYSVDDVVIGKTDGTEICCQCKKNQQNFSTWTISNLADELEKAFSLLASNRNAEVCFYSRCPFSALAKLREYSITQPNEISYRENMGIEHQKIDAELSARISKQSQSLSSYEFLNRTSFEISPDYQRMESQLHERLRSIASNPDAAYNALWTSLDKLGGRMDGASGLSSPQHRLTKEDLKTILQQAGAMLAPNMNLAEVRTLFNNTSAIGRSWNRVIAGERIDTPVLKKLLEAVDTKNRSILLTGLPGSGKTCVMLALQEALEKRAQNCTDIVPLFIQSREFADLATAQDRQAQGLPEQWVEKASRMADQAHVVIVIDSLDVLSIAREHSVLTYFLAQIDRLLLIPNITVVTACRDFDRHYDRRIAEREWDAVLNCAPLNWDVEIVPLLNKIGIDTTAIDVGTRELIQNPRELALFVELAKQEGSFNVITSQALAQRYLDNVVRANDALGETAIQTIEAIATEMLNSRSLAVPYQRFAAPQDIQRLLLSLNVLQETQDGKLTFGHQTLLDVLVISGAVRQGVTLNEFIQGLSPVPFVRPSIRSFIAQLGMGERSVFRKQLRTVLASDTAFHIRRLVAESFAEQIPQDDDWSLLRDLRNNHREVFQVIYSQAVKIDWHHYWLKHLLPILIDTQDAEGLAAHVHRVSQWKNDDVVGVLQFWTEALSLSWFEGKEISDRLGYYLSEIDTNNLSLVVPLLEKLLNMPQEEHGLLGRAVAHCAKAGVLKDSLLWLYVAGDITDEDVIKYRFDSKLRCRPHEFSQKNDEFFYNKMEQSSELLDLAMTSIEQWSETRSSRHDNPDKSFYDEFLTESSHDNSRGQHDRRHVDSESILMDAIEAAILNHAQGHSKWWLKNRERVCFNHEGALRYFAILACTSFPHANIDLVARMLCDKELLESSLSYELGTLMQAAFVYLDEPSQDAVMGCINTVLEELTEDDHYSSLILKQRARLVITIPCYLRSPEAQAVVDDYVQREMVLIHQPDIHRHCGTVSAPFSYEIFLGCSDSGILNLLEHYLGYDGHFDDFLNGGQREVGGQLREASSRNPTRFLKILTNHWENISEVFRDDIMCGVVTYLDHRYGHLQTNNVWEPIEEPDAPTLMRHILDELERHSNHWHHNRVTSNALCVCAHIVLDVKDAERLVFKAIEFASFREEKTINEGSGGLIGTGLNMVCGNIVDALMIVATNFQEKNIKYPELLVPTLHRFAGHEHPAIRAMTLRRLPYLQSLNPVLGWDLFERAIQGVAGIWSTAERCLYYTYHNHIEKVSPLLDRIKTEGSTDEMEIWGRISALAALSNRIDFIAWLEDLKALDVKEAWKGAATVWTHSENFKQHRDQCLAGIEAGLNDNSRNANIIAHQMEGLFRGNSPFIFIPIEIIQLFYTALEIDDEDGGHRHTDLGNWLNEISQHDPDQAIGATEIYLSYVKRVKPYLYDHENNFTQLMTRLFAEAEEREESDNGEMLLRVVNIQDTLLSLGLEGINTWLKAAERP